MKRINEQDVKTGKIRYLLRVPGEDNLFEFESDENRENFITQRLELEKPPDTRPKRHI